MIRIYADFNGLQGSRRNPSLLAVPLDTFGSLRPTGAFSDYAPDTHAAATAIGTISEAGAQALHLHAE
jgi:hypothetical protein